MKKNKQSYRHLWDIMKQTHASWESQKERRERGRKNTRTIMVESFLNWMESDAHIQGASELQAG